MKRLMEVLLALVVLASFASPVHANSSDDYIIVSRWDDDIISLRWVDPPIDGYTECHVYFNDGVELKVPLRHVDFDGSWVYEAGWDSYDSPKEYIAMMSYCVIYGQYEGVVRHLVREYRIAPYEAYIPLITFS